MWLHGYLSIYLKNSTDPSRKPKMALSITSFQALCGFRPSPETANFLNNTPELQALIPPFMASKFLLISASNSTELAEEVSLKTIRAGLTPKLRDIS